MSYQNDGITFCNLDWDTEYFGVTCAKVILSRPIELSEWHDLVSKFKDYQFISIENRNSEPINTQYIGKDTRAFLADVNIQFVKKVEAIHEVAENITLHQALKENNQILDLAGFQFSKFTEDPGLEGRGGDQIYRLWLRNSFEKQNKFYALYAEEPNVINGFLLHSYSDNKCVVELIATTTTKMKSGIGSKLFKAVEHAASKRGIGEINVGTQLRNTGAINFYHKVGCKQVGCHQIYHLWNL